MKIAIISDIHSNIYALEAVLKDIDTKSVDCIINLGDTLLGAVDPIATAKRLMKLDNLINIMGNGDEMLLQEKIKSESYNFTKPLLDEEITGWIKKFKDEWIFENVLFIHGSPDSKYNYLTEIVTEHGIMKKNNSVLNDEIKDIGQKYIVCGHSHMSGSVYVSSGKLIINPGSVGLPAYSDMLPFPHSVENHTPYAKYAMITIENQYVTSIEYNEVSYDWHVASDVARNNNREDYAIPILTGMVLK